MVERLDAMVARLDQLEARLRAKEGEQMITSHWTSGGEPRTWTTTWKQFDPDETLEACLLRHKDEVRTAKAVFPKDP